MKESTFEYLYGKYLNQIIKFLSIQYDVDLNTAKDLTHEVFAVLWQKRDKIYYNDEKQLLSWLYETAKIKAKEYNRNLSRLKIDYILDAEDFNDAYMAKFDDLIYTEELSHNYQEEKYKKYLSDIKKQLNAKERLLFECIVEKKMSPTDAADILNITSTNLRVRWHRLRIKLKPIVDKIFYK